MGNPAPVEVPTMKGISGSFKDFGIGLLGGLIFLVAYRLFGGLGILAAPLIAGSMIKGAKGETISTMSGFMVMALAAIMGFGGGGGGNADSGDM